MPDAIFADGTARAPAGGESVVARISATKLARGNCYGMAVTFTFGTGFVNSLIGLPKPVYPKLARCLQLLSRNRDYPGLNVEKLHGRSNGLSSARVDSGYRLIFQDIPGNRVVLVFVGKEDDAYRKAETIGKATRFCFRPPILAVAPANARPSAQSPLAAVQMESPQGISAESAPMVGLTFSEIKKLVESTREKGESSMAQTKHADRIREFANSQYIQPARDNKSISVTIRAGDVAKALKLQDRIAAVCSALGARTFENRYNVKLVERTGPHTSTTTEFKFRI